MLPLEGDMPSHRLEEDAKHVAERFGIVGLCPMADRQQRLGNLVGQTFVFDMLRPQPLRRPGGRAISTDCAPLSAAISIVMKATMVLPEPTSPCSSRFICLPAVRSLYISFTTRFWALVKSKVRWFL